MPEAAEADEVIGRLEVIGVLEVIGILETTEGAEEIRLLTRLEELVPFFVQPAISRQTAKTSTGARTTGNSFFIVLPIPFDWCGVRNRRTGGFRG